VFVVVHQCLVSFGGFGSLAGSKKCWSWTLPSRLWITTSPPRSLTSRFAAFLGVRLGFVVPHRLFRNRLRHVQALGLLGEAPEPGASSTFPMSPAPRRRRSSPAPLRPRFACACGGGPRGHPAPAACARAPALRRYVWASASRGGDRRRRRHGRTAIGSSSECRSAPQRRSG
jgi:hypothetical protein